MSYWLRYAIHNTPVAQLEVARLYAENKQLRALLGTENIPQHLLDPPIPTPTNIHQHNVVRTDLYQPPTDQPDVSEL